MLPRFSLPRCRLLLFAVALCGMTLALPAAKPPTNARPRATGSPTTATNAASKEIEIPKSVFDLPRTPQEGKDPFFPKSTRVYNSTVVATNAQAAAGSAGDLQLKGFSGTHAHRLAIINNRTFEAGEQGEVTTSTGRVRIRCLEIKTDTVIIQIGAEQRELHLRSGV